MSERILVKVGQIVEFAGYQSIEDDVKPMLEEGQRIVILHIGPNPQGDMTYNVRPVDENDEIDECVYIYLALSAVFVSSWIRVSLSVCVFL